MTADVPSFKC